VKLMLEAASEIDEDATAEPVPIEVERDPVQPPE